jgi:DNA-binding CsgD family transcriptional regulator
MAAERFATRWNAYRAESATNASKEEHDNLYPLFKRTVWAVWTAYLESLSITVFTHLLRGSRLPVADFSKAATRFVAFERESSLFAQCLESAEQHEYYASLTTVLCIIEDLSAASKEVRKDIPEYIEARHSWYSVQCNWRSEAGESCGQLTEYEAYAKGFQLSGKESTSVRSLSRTRCKDHSSGVSLLLAYGKAIPNSGRLPMSGPKNSGDGLCRFCGRLTEWAAHLDTETIGRSAANISSRRANLSRHYCIEHRPKRSTSKPNKVLGSQNSAEYRRALRHSAEFTDLLWRLQIQTHHGGDVKQLHSAAMVNWFENTLVKKIGAESWNTCYSWLRLKAEEQACALLSEICVARPQDIVSAVVSILEGTPPTLSRHLDQEKIEAIKNKLEAVKQSAPTLFESLAILALSARGRRLKEISAQLGVSESFVARVVRLNTPQMSPDEDNSNLARAAHNLIAQKMTDRKKQIVALLATGATQSEVARTLGIARQEVSRTLKSIPRQYRFDLQRT